MSQSPARAEPHDARRGCRSPTTSTTCPPLHALLDPHPEHQAAIVAEAEAVAADALAVAEASSAPSPARAEPHDAATWLPLPTPRSSRRSPTSSRRARRSGTAPPRRRRHRFLPAPRVLGVAVMVVLTALGGAWLVQQATAPSGSEVTLVVDGARQEVHTDAELRRRAPRRRPGAPRARRRRRAVGKSSLHDGLHIDVLRAFPVSVDVDGSVRTVRTVETSAEGLAKQMKLGKLTAVRNNPGRLAAGATVVYRTRVAGSLTIDDQKVTFDSPSRTVDELLQSYNVKLVGDDYVTPELGQRAARRRRGRSGPRRRRDLPEHPDDRVRHRGAGRPDAPHRPDPHHPGRQGRHHDRHLPPAGRERREGREAGGVRGADGRTDAEDHRHRLLRQPEVGRAGECESGGRWDTVDSGPDGYDGGLGIYRGTWRGFGGSEFASNAGLATREQQIIVGMRIYEKLGWDPWGCANNVLHWPQWSM